MYVERAAARRSGLSGHAESRAFEVEVAARVRAEHVPGILGEVGERRLVQEGHQAAQALLDTRWRRTTGGLRILPVSPT